MIKAVLLDLDNTLIENPFNRLGQRIDTWNDFFQARTGLPDAGEGLVEALKAVTLNLDPQRTNMAVLLNSLSARWEQSEADVLAVFQDFYAQVYAEMAHYVHPKASAPILLNWLHKAGYHVVIATNPLFTADAVQERLGWGGLPTDLTAYTLVTHLENMHFAKPMPHYYEEILGRLGITTDEAIMVGDDWQNDIVPAARAGLNSFWITPDRTPPGPEPIPLAGRGTLHDFTLKVCNQGWLDTLQPRPVLPSMLPPRLIGNVAALFDILAEYAPNYWQQHPDPDEWSPLEVICHLRDSERLVQRPRLERIAREDNPFLSAPQDPPGPGDIRCVAETHTPPAQEFAAEREKTIAFLQNLPAASWERPARHSIFGPTTLLEMANFTATHDRLHFQQICQTLGRCE